MRLAARDLCTCGHDFDEHMAGRCYSESTLTSSDCLCKGFAPHQACECGHGPAMHIEGAGCTKLTPRVIDGGLRYCNCTDYTRVTGSATLDLTSKKGAPSMSDACQCGHAKGMHTVYLNRPCDAANCSCQKFSVPLWKTNPSCASCHHGYNNHYVNDPDPRCDVLGWGSDAECGCSEFQNQHRGEK